MTQNRYENHNNWELTKHRSSCLLISNKLCLKFLRMIEIILFVKTSPLHPICPKLPPGIIIEKPPSFSGQLSLIKKLWNIVFIYSYVKLDPNSCPSIPQGIIIWRYINVSCPRMLSFKLSLLCPRFIQFALFVSKPINTWRIPMNYIISLLPQYYWMNSRQGKTVSRSENNIGQKEGFLSSIF